MRDLATELTPGLRPRDRAGEQEVADAMFDAGDVSVFPAHRYTGGTWIDVAHLHLWRDRWQEATTVVRTPPSRLAELLAETLAP